MCCIAAKQLNGNFYVPRMRERPGEIIKLRSNPEIFKQDVADGAVIWQLNDKAFMSSYMNDEAFKRVMT